MVAAPTNSTEICKEATQPRGQFLIYRPRFKETAQVPVIHHDQHHIQPGLGGDLDALFPQHSNSPSFSKQPIPQ